MTTTPSRKGIGGPKTPEGKKRSAMNALKPRGLSDPTLEEQAGVSYEELLHTMQDYYKPADPVEEELVRRIARCAVRLRISEVMERRSARKSSYSPCPDVSYSELMKFERLVDIHLHRAIRTLAQKRQADEKVQKRTRLHEEPTLESMLQNELIST
jgi:hypothetical protein